MRTYQKGEMSLKIQMRRFGEIKFMGLGGALEASYPFYYSSRGRGSSLWFISSLRAILREFGYVDALRGCLACFKWL